jgi:hypothetical protein
VIITPLSEPIAQYTQELTNCKTLISLQEFLERWGDLAPDAFNVGLTLNEKTFREFLHGFKKERRGIYAGDEWADKYGAILIPELFLFVQMVANEFHVPFGVAFLRLEKEGIIYRRNGAYARDKRP